MAKTPVRTLRLSDEDWQLISTRAKEAGVSVSEYLRGLVLTEPLHGGFASPDHSMAPGRPPARSRVEVKTPKVETPKRNTAVARSRTHMCVHRIAADAYCSRCDG